jgi:hypothetical protein
MRQRRERQQEAPALERTPCSMSGYDEVGFMAVAQATSISPAISR